jgi:glycosyltransferase involved in cell wall biosynthesis
MPALSLSMIVKDEENHLVRCLSSVKDVVDEIVIVDTGSSDKTIEIAESFGAKIFHFDWVDDFSSARNFALSKCTGDWILYLDADEELNPDYIEEINNFKTRPPAGIYCTIKSRGSSTANGSVIRYPRLFANVSGIEFNGKVHEQIIDSLKKNKVPLIDSNIEIIHHGYVLDNEGLKQKKERNLALLLSSENYKSNIYDKLKLIQTLISLEKYDEAEVRLNKLMNDKSLSGEKRSLSYYYMASIEFERNDLSSALEFSLKANRNLTDKPELNYLLYLILLRMDKKKEAMKYLLTCIKTNKKLLDNSSSFKNENILDQIELYLRAIQLNITFNNENDDYKVIEEFSEFLSKENGIDSKIIFSIFENLLLNYSLSYSNADLLRKLISSSHLTIILDMIKRCNDNLVLNEIINLLLQYFPGSALLYRNLALLFINSDNDKAIEIFNKSLEIEDDPSTYIQLISIYISKKDYSKVKETFNILQNRFSKNIRIKQKIDILREKLNPILSASAY